MCVLEQSTRARHVTTECLVRGKATVAVVMLIKSVPTFCTHLCVTQTGPRHLLISKSITS